MEKMPSFENEDIAHTEASPEQVGESVPDYAEVINNRIESFFRDTANNLSEKILGMKVDNPEIINRLVEDQKVIRAKYGLPDLDARESLGDYENYLRNRVSELGVTIEEESGCGKFFEEFRQAGGVFMDNERKIGVNIKKDDVQEYARSLNTLEHELIHAIQNIRYPSMPIELMEYEAYVAGGNMGVLREDTEIVEVLFGLLIEGSVRHWYEEKNIIRN
jgi:hypothetical protein